MSVEDLEKNRYGEEISRLEVGTSSIIAWRLLSSPAHLVMTI